MAFKNILRLILEDKSFFYVSYFLVWGLKKWGKGEGGAPCCRRRSRNVVFDQLRRTKKARELER